MAPRPADPLSDEVRRQRNRQFVQEFEQRRSAAEITAAKSRYEQGDLPGFRIALEQILQRAPDHREARLLMIGLELSEFHPEQARVHAETLLANRPDDPEANHAMGLILEACGQTDAAVAYYERAKPQAVGMVQAGAVRNAKANQASALSSDRDDSSVRAVAHHESAPEASANAKTPPRKLPQEAMGRPGPLEGAATSSPGNGAKKADADWTAYAESTEDIAIGELLSTADDSLRQGDTDAAWAVIQQAAALSPHDPQIPTTAAVSALRHNQPEFAVRLLSAAAQRFPQSATIHRTLGTAYYRLGDYKSSQLALQQALSLDKSSALTYLLLGCTLAKLGRPDAAEPYFRQARLIDPRYTIQR